jgi:light-regulated signal transduction histidine kinase (bacteriophytochrome)
MLIAPDTEILGAPDECAREPIHIIGHIQSHGLLFALSEPDLVVRQVSANVADLLGTAIDSVLGASLETVLGARQFAFFRSNAIAEDAGIGKPFRVNVGRGGESEMNCVAHRQDGVLIVEFELLKDIYSLGPIDLAAHIQAPLARVQKASDVESLARVAVSEIQRLSGFDRVMVYQFDEAWNGVIIAEHAGASPTSYLGLHFPASDVPAQARKLFLSNFLRTIADVDSVAVPIVPEVGPLTRRPLDLTRSFLRSAAPVHMSAPQ